MDKETSAGVDNELLKQLSAASRYVGPIELMGADIDVVEANNVDEGNVHLGRKVPVPSKIAIATYESSLKAVLTRMLA